MPTKVLWSRLWFFQWPCIDVRVGLWGKLSTKKLMLLNCGVGEDLIVHLTARRSNQSILKEISPRCSLEGLMLKLKLQYFGHWCEELTHWKRPWCWQGLGAGGEGDDRRWVDWMASPTQWTWVWVSSGAGDGQGGLACWDSWGCKELDTTEWLNWTELKMTEVISQLLWFVFLWWLVMLSTCSPKSTYLLRPRVYSVAHFSSHVFDKGFICWALRSKIQKNISLPHCKKSSIRRHFQASSALSLGGPFPRAPYHRADWHPEIVGKAPGLSFCSCLLLTSLVGKWNLFCSFLFSVEIYWKIFLIAKNLKILSPGSSFIYILEKYWIEIFFFP